MNKIKKFQFHATKDTLMTRVHLMRFLDLLRTVCETDKDRGCFYLIFAHMEPGNVIPDFWSRDGLRNIKDMIDILWEADYVRPYDDDVDAFVVNPALIAYGLTRSERKDLRYKYRFLKTKGELTSRSEE